MMTLRAAVQMDPMDTINIAGDSSFALMLTAQERGYTVYHYDVRGLTWEAGRLTTPAHRVLDVRREAGAHYRLGEAVTLELGRGDVVVLMREDPPIDLGYLTCPCLLDRLAGQSEERRGGKGGVHNGSSR